MPKWFSALLDSNEKEFREKEKEGKNDETA